MREVNATPTSGTASPNPADESSDAVAATSQVGPWAMVPVWVLNMGLTGTEVAIYVSLRSFCDRGGHCFPTARTVSERAGCSISSVRNAVQKFRRLAILTTTKVWRPGTRELAHLRYHLVDLDPRRWTVQAREASPEPDGGVPQLSDTPTSAEVQVSLSQVTQEHTKEHTKELGSEVEWPSKAGRDDGDPNLPTMTEEAINNERPAFSDWRAEDRDLFRSIVGDKVISDGSVWTEGTFPADAWYESLRTKAEPIIKWPGLFMQRLIDTHGLDNWLFGKGLELDCDETRAA